MAKRTKKTSKKEQPNYKVVSVIELTKRTWLELSTFWKPLAGVTAVYAVLYFIFILGFNIASSFQSQVIDDSLGRFGQAGASISAVATNMFSGSQSDATTLVQILLFLISSLAIIWTLRKLQALKKITVRDAFYQGSSQIIPVIMVSIVLILTLLPAVLGSSILAIVLQAGGFQIAVVLIGVAAGLLLFVSLLLFTMFWPAFYIASLPQTRPLQALKSALSVTKKRRLSILRKLLFLILLIVVGLIVVLLPVALISAAIVPYTFFIVIFCVFLYSQVYLYELYRSLL